MRGVNGRLAGILLVMLIGVGCMGLMAQAGCTCVDGEAYQDVIVSEAGSTWVNGTYRFVGSPYGSPRFNHLGGGVSIYYSSMGQWRLGADSTYYKAQSTAPTPPHEGWESQSGADPAPVLSGGEACSCGPTITVSAISGPTTESGGTATFTLTPDPAPTADVTVPLSSSNTLEGTVQAEVVLPAGSTDPVTVTVTGVNDDIDDGNIAYTIVTGDPVSQGDADYEALGADDVDDVSVTNTDDDTKGITVTPTSGLITTEAGGTATFTVVLDSEPTTTVTIPISSDNANEGTASPATLTFTPADWYARQTVTVTGVNDLADDGNVVYNIITGAAMDSSGDYAGFNAADVQVTNNNVYDASSSSIIIIPSGGGGPEAFLDAVLPSVDGEAPLMAGTLPLSAIHVAGAAIEGGCQILGSMGLPTCASYIHVYFYSVDINATPETIALVMHSIATFHWDTLEHRFSVDTSGLAPGFYDLRLVFEDGSAVTLRVQITDPTD